MENIKYKIYKGIHDYPIDVWMMWGILAALIIGIIIKLYFKITDYSATYQFIKNL